MGSIPHSVGTQLLIWRSISNKVHLAPCKNRRCGVKGEVNQWEPEACSRLFNPSVQPMSTEDKPTIPGLTERTINFLSHPDLSLKFNPFLRWDCVHDPLFKGFKAISWEGAWHRALSGCIGKSHHHVIVFSDRGKRQGNQKCEFDPLGGKEQACLWTAVMAIESSADRGLIPGL